MTCIDKRKVKEEKKTKKNKKKEKHDDQNSRLFNNPYYSIGPCLPNFLSLPH